MTLSFQPLSLAEVHRRRAAARTLSFEVAVAPEADAGFEVLDLSVVDQDEVR